MKKYLCMGNEKDIDTCEYEKYGCKGCYFYRVMEDIDKRFYVTFNVEGKAQAKQRPRFSRISGRAYTPKNTINFELWVKQCFMKYLEDKDITAPTEKPLKVKITCYYQVPLSVSKKKKEQMLNGDIVPNVKPDVDNVAKSILDALNGIAYIDDKQIIKLSIQKKYDTHSWTNITIDEWQ